MYSAIAVIIAVGVTAVAYTTRRATAGVIAAIGWMLLSYAAYRLSTATWDSYFILFWVSIIITVAVFIESGYMRFGADRAYREPKQNQEKAEKKGVTERETSYEHPMDMKRAKLGLKPIHKEAEERKKNRAFFGR